MSKKLPIHVDSMNNQVNLKIAILGQSIVGKTAITHVFMNGKFPTEHDTTIEDQFTIPSTIDGYECQLQIVDTAGHDDYQTMLDTWISNADGFILVYSIDDKDSFVSVGLTYERIIKIKENKKFGVVIVGNKCDLEDKRKVTREEAERYCQGLNLDFMESSALQKINIKEPFLCVAKSLLKIKYPEHFNEEDQTTKKRCYCF